MMTCYYGLFDCHVVSKSNKSMSLQVADDLVTEFADPNNNIASPDQVLCIFHFHKLCLGSYKTFLNVSF